MLNFERENQLHPCWSEQRGNIFAADVEKAATAVELPIASALFSQERPTSHSGGTKIAVQPLF